MKRFSVGSAADVVDPVYQLLKNGVGLLAAPYQVDVFPPNSGEATARQFLELLPPPARVAPFSWAHVARADREIGKFTVSPGELRRAVGRVLPLAGVERADVVDLDDSVILLTPG